MLLTKLDDEELLHFFLKIRKRTKELIGCKYGNFLIQELLARDLEAAKKIIKKVILKHFKFFLGLKYTKYVICPLIGDRGEKRVFSKTIADLFLSMKNRE